MQPIGVLSYFKLCLLVAICIADSSSDSNSSTDDGTIVKLDAANAMDANAVKDANLENEANSVNDVNLEDADAANANAVDFDADNANVKLENTDTNEPINDEQGGDQVENEPTYDQKENDKSSITDDLQGANQPAVGGETENDEQGDDVSGANVPIDGDENKIKGETEESMNTDVKDDGAMPEEKVDINKKSHQDKTYDLPNESPSGWTPIDKTFAIPAFKLSAAEMEKFKIWPEAKIPYFIDEFSYDKVLRDKIRGYLDEAQHKTLVHFHELSDPPSDENDRWVFFVNRRGHLDCKDYSTKSFTNSGVQKVIVGYDCLRHGGPMAAIVLALLGVPPQHNSPDRDRYIVVDKEHILPEKRGLFKRLNNDEWLFHDLEYDYDSASHYPPHKYTADGSITIKINTDNPEQKGPIQLPNPKNMYYGEATTYSQHDINKVAMLYNNIIYKRNVKGMDHEDCKALYKPVPNLKNTRLKSPIKFLERPKPKLYLAAIKKLYAVKDIDGETLSSLEDRKYYNRKKAK